MLLSAACCRLRGRAALTVDVSLTECSVLSSLCEREIPEMRVTVSVLLILFHFDFVDRVFFYFIFVFLAFARPFLHISLPSLYPNVVAGI